MTAYATPQIAWYVAYTKPRQEYIAKTNLEHQNFEVYLPLFKTFRKPRKSRILSQSETQLTHEPMFPRYIFFKPKSATQSLSTLRSTRGVTSIIMIGTRFAQVSVELLQSIRAAEQLRDEAGIDQVSPFLPGSRVRLCDRALSSLEGLVQEVSAKRVILLLEILGRQKMLKVDFNQIEAL